MKDNFGKIEKKWQDKWEKGKVFEVKEKGNKYYVLEMFPYPSSSGLHMGHASNYTKGDIYARFKRMNGFNVLYPMGYDALGLPAENAAIKEKVHPKKFTEKSIKNFIRQQKSLGLSYDWTKMIRTSDPEYYKWNQYFFLKFLENGLVYRKKAAVNFCRKCDTVLANEQVHDGKCWRHEDVDVEIKSLEQWFIKTTKYADELLGMVDDLNWPEKIKIMQKNWIGKSYGTEILFDINGKKWPVFTTRPDTIYGVTFMVISAQHARLMEIVSKEQENKVKDFVKKNKDTNIRNLDEMEKLGVFSGSYAINPINNKKIPVWVGNFVLADYGSGMVMAVPAHDQRDYEFARKYNLPIKFVINKDLFNVDVSKMRNAYIEDGVLINSEKFDGLKNREAIKEITKRLEKKKMGKASIQYKLKDWLVSRQRYWGTPIPIIYCNDCGIVPVPGNQLPVLLPEKVKFGKGNPLLSNKSFVNVKCPKCNRKARRETDTMDTFFDSSWYFLRFVDNKNIKQPFDSKIIDKWMPVDQYIGGAEHACMHLIYARFFVKALRDLGFLKIDEPFTKLFNQGMLHGDDGFVMSKSRGNIVTPEKVSEKFGIDTARLFLVSIASPEKDTQWSEKGIDGSLKFIRKVFDYFKKPLFRKSSKILESRVNKMILEISNDIENFRYNFAVIKLRDLFDVFVEEDYNKKDLEKFLKLFSVFCPHIAEELWEKIGNKGFISLASWAVCDESKINDMFEKQEQINQNTISDIMNIIGIVKEKEKKNVKKVYLYVIPNELLLFDETKFSNKIGREVRVFGVNDKKKYDPDNKAKKAKPGRPGIYVE